MELRTKLSISSLAASALVLLLAASPTVLAHDHYVAITSSPGTMDMDMTSHSSPSNSSAPIAPVESEPSYFRHEDYHWILLTHIILMSLSWIFVLPISIMLTISRSIFRLPVQFSFLVLNSIGVFCSIIYNSNTPYLYPGNAHHSLGWVVTWIVGVQMLLALLNAYTATEDQEKGNGEEYRPLNTEVIRGRNELGAGDKHYVKPEHRYYDDSGQGSSLQSSSFSSLNHVQDDEPLYNVELRTPSQPAAFKSKYLPGSLWIKFDKVNSTLSGRTLRILGTFESVITRTILPLGYSAFLAGIATYGGLFRGQEIFSGLAHWIKGSVFFWYGLLTLGRWVGCFADRGWAWNVLPVSQGRRKWSAEFVESFLIFFYGVTNVFLEHLSSWGKEWSMIDLQHLGIAILFAGGGLCGMLIESTKIRNLLNSSNELLISGSRSSKLAHRNMKKSEDEESEILEPPATYRFSTNPLPALTIILLGLLMSSHHQTSMVSTMIHAQWGHLLMCGALARGGTYLLCILKPPTSILPGRPPTEVVAAFCFIAGGVVFMVSTRDTVTVLEQNGLDGMFAFTIVCGSVAMLMAWELVVLSIKGWAVSRQTRNQDELKELVDL